MSNNDSADKHTAAYLNDHWKGYSNSLGTITSSNVNEWIAEHIVGDKFYGGMRYTDEMDEKKIEAQIANMVCDRIFEPTNEIELHAKLGRKVELLEGAMLIADFQM